MNMPVDFLFLVSSILTDIYAIWYNSGDEWGVEVILLLYIHHIAPTVFAHSDDRNSIGRLASGQTFDSE